MTEIRHIVFDIGRVLLHWDPELLYRELIPDDERRRWFMGTVCTDAWNLEQDRGGRSWADAEAVLVAEFPDEEPLIRAYRARWNEMVPHAYDDVVAVFNGLIDDDHDVTMLTNFNDDTFAEAVGRYPFLERPRGVTVSADVGLLKPEQAIYDHHASNFGLDPAATFFTDDSPKNIAGAKAAGWHAELFEGADKLKADLTRLGVLA